MQLTFIEQYYTIHIKLNTNFKFRKLNELVFRLY